MFMHNQPFAFIRLVVLHDPVNILRANGALLIRDLPSNLGLVCGLTILPRQLRPTLCETG
jgi:hypothetical protein